jgi:myo-inositol-1(or 4)-monophosphatase
MEKLDPRKALAAAVNAARAVGRLMRANLREVKTVNLSTQHDIKLELDVRSQKLIEKKLSAAFPKIALLGEEGMAGAVDAERRWVVDPIDGTVNFTYGIPHACVSTKQTKGESGEGEWRAGARIPHHGSRIPHYDALGVGDPFTDELWTAVRGRGAPERRAIRAAAARNSGGHRCH